MEIKYFDHPNDDFKKLDQMINDEDFERFGEAALKYVSINTLDGINDFFVVYENDEAIACGCIKHFKYAPDSIELKRIFVIKPKRRKNIASAVVEKCEDKARELGYKYIVLVTGVDMDEPLGLYKKLGYEYIDNYGPYVGNQVTVCMRKLL